MINVSAKPFTLRSAKARGQVLCAGATLNRIKSNDLPKGNLFDVARAAGLLAAKNAAHLIPHCHPIPLEFLNIDFQINEQGIIILAEGKTISRTGLEMEVLTAVTVTALTLYDLLKPIDKNLEISGIRLLEKSGGKSTLNKNFPQDIAAAILVCSDSVSEGRASDSSGKKIKEILATFSVSVTDSQIIPDEPAQIRQKITDWVKQDIPYIFITGGTGLGPRDQTVETIQSLIEKEAPGIAEAMRAYGQERTPYAMFSRCVAGSIQNTLVISLPGSEAGAEDGLHAVLPALFHARAMLKGERHQK